MTTYFFKWFKSSGVFDPRVTVTLTALTLPMISDCGSESAPTCGAISATKQEVQTH